MFRRVKLYEFGSFAAIAIVEMIYPSAASYLEPGETLFSHGPNAVECVFAPDLSKL